MASCYTNIILILSFNVLCITTCTNASPLINSRNINAAECVIDACWDPELTSIDLWHADPNCKSGLKFKQAWDRMYIQWEQKLSNSGAVAIVSRDYEVNCSGYDELVVSAAIPKGVLVKLKVFTENGVLISEKMAPRIKDEYTVKLNEASHISKLVIELFAKKKGNYLAGLFWIGLVNNSILPNHIKQFQNLALDWKAEGYLKGDGYKPKFEPVYGFVISPEELLNLRRKYEQFRDVDGRGILHEVARNINARPSPESLINEFVGFANDTRYSRVRDYNKIQVANEAFGYGGQAALAGLVFKDRRLLELGARYALSLAMCPHWDAGFVCDFPGSYWSQRCFVQSLCIHDTAMVLDLAGELFTDLGRDIILRRITENMAAINYATWKYEYIFNCNQLSWFSHGRILGYSMLEQNYPRTRNYTEIAYNELLESINRIMLPDGGYAEGPMYFGAVAQNACLALRYYARAREKDINSILPQSLRQTNDFAGCLRSTDESIDLIPVGDATRQSKLDYLAIMASVLPRSQWTSLFKKRLLRGDKKFTGGGILSELYNIDIDNTPVAPVFINLPDTGLMCSQRKVSQHQLKILIIGKRAGSTHQHEDTGSFVIEFAGETFACDLGADSYAVPMGYVNAQRHNMLVPEDENLRSRPDNPLKKDAKPTGFGDEQQFHAKIDASVGWGGYYKKWFRHWDSNEPSSLTITDEFETEDQRNVKFYWQTFLPVSIEGNLIKLTGKRGSALITVPKDCKVNLEELPTYDNIMQKRIAISPPYSNGKLIIKIKFNATFGEF